MLIAQQQDLQQQQIVLEVISKENYWFTGY
jgi:hypothetical protein